MAQVWDAERVRQDDHRRAVQGWRSYAVAARSLATGELAGLTQVSVDPAEPAWGLQELTAVAGPYRGHRLGLLVKVAMLELLAEREPQLTRIVTGNADGNEHMIAINDELGSTVLDQWPSWELEVAQALPQPRGGPDYLSGYCGISSYNARKGDTLCRGGWGGGGSGRRVLQVHNFTYGVLTPVLGYIMSCMGAFLGLRCTTRARPFQGMARARWLLLGGVSIGTTGVWLMHFIAMLGFTVPGETIDYNVPVTILSLLVVVGIVCVGLLIVGFGRDRYTSLILGGVITGTGVAVMHYLGMAAMRMPGRISYDPGLLIISVMIAIVAATAALWAALELQGVGTTLIASLIMGLAVSGMHYTGMAAMDVFPASGPAGMVMGGPGGATAESFLLPLILGITVISFVLTATIALSPSAEEIRYDAALLDHIRRRTQPQR